MADQILYCRVCGSDFILPDGVVMRACLACGTSHSRPRAEGSVVFARAKERLFGTLPLLVYMDGVPNQVSAIATGQETPIRCSHPCRLTVRSNDGAEVWSCDERGGVVLRVEVSWPMMGRPRFVVR